MAAVHIAYQRERERERKRDTEDITLLTFSYYIPWQIDMLTEPYPLIE